MRGEIVAILSIVMWSFCYLTVMAQLKTVVEDFEGYADGQTSFHNEGIFSFGAVDLMAEQKTTTGYGYSSRRALKVSWNGLHQYGGFGRGLGLFKELDYENDHVVFYLKSSVAELAADSLRIILEDDDNDDGSYSSDKDDQWTYTYTFTPCDDWQKISIPLSGFVDKTTDGDGRFNITHREGKLLTVIFEFLNTESYTPNTYWCFDFIGFSKGELPTEDDVFQPAVAEAAPNIVLGAWSKEGNEAKFSEIPKSFEGLFAHHGIDKKLGVVSFYKPFALDAATHPNLFPPVEQIQGLIDSGYLPMITFEAQYVTNDTNFRQPNLYSINEGWFDEYFTEWANRIKQVEGPVLLRLLHEFNGNWYPWSISENDQNPYLYIKAYRRIHIIFRSNGADNVHFVWCPNSMSTPQARWNYIMDAYPGDEYVDFVGLDVFNGAGQSGIPLWRSFRYEAIDNYYLLTTRFPAKPLLICETSSRERYKEETGYLPHKAGWIKDQAEALTTDLSKTKLLVWFHQYEDFKVNSSLESENAYYKYIWRDERFSGSPELLWPVKP